MLRKITDPHVVPELALAALHGQHTGKQFEQGRFAGAVRPDQHGALTALRLEVQSSINDQFAVCVVDILQSNRPQSAPRRLRKTKFDRLRLRGRRGDFFHPIDLLQFALRLRRFARLRPEAIGELLERRDFFLLIFVGRELLFFARGFLFDVAVPVAAITEQLRIAISTMLPTSAFRNSRSCEIMRIAPG